MKKVISVLLILLLMAFLFVGCSDNNEPKQNEATEEQGKVNEDETDSNIEGPKKGGTLLVGLGNDPISFNPNAYADDDYYHIAMNIFNRLIKLNNKQEIVPDLAKEWTVSDDGKEIVFYLRENVKWHDGEPFSSKDVKFTFDTIIEQKGQISSSLASIEEVTTPDDYTVVFKLKENDSSLMRYLAWYACFIIPEHLYAGTDWLENPANQNPVGTGPFKFSEHKKGVNVTIVRNDDYWGDIPYLDKVVYQIIPDGNTALQALYNGELDVLEVSVPLSEVETLKSNSNITTGMQMWPARYQVAFNITDDVFSDLKVRQAITYGLDKDEIIKKALKGAGEKSDYAIIPMFEWAVNSDAKFPDRDIEKAKSLLEEAGYKADTNGMYMSVVLDAWNDVPYSDIATVIKDQLKDIGIDVKLNITEMAAWTDKVWVNHNYQMAVLGGYQGPDAGGFAMRFATDASMNIYNYSNPEIDKAFENGRLNVKDEDRKPYYQDAQRILVEDIPMVPISEMMIVTPYQAYVEGHPLSEEAIDKAGFYEHTYVWINQ